MKLEELKIEAVLWTSEARADGSFSIFLRLTHYKTVKYLPTGYGASFEQWNKERKMPDASHPQAKKISKKLQDLEDDVKFLLKLAEMQNEEITLRELKQRVDKKYKSKGTAPMILEFFDQIIGQLEKAENPNYADVFTYCKLKLSRFLNDLDKSFATFTKSDAIAYEQFIKSTKPTDSTVSYYLRGFYRVWNLAQAERFVEKGRHPKQFITFKAYKHIKTKKKAIKAPIFTQMMALKFPHGSRRWKHILYMKFMYYSRGMNFGDMCKLTKPQVLDWQLEYKRSKNKRDYSFHMHPKAIEIVKIFEAFPVQSDNGYVFPILMKIHDTARKKNQRIKSALKDFNEDMKYFAEEAGMQRLPSSNDIRHSFASHLRNKGVHTPYIQEAMGHETEEQLRTYLDDIDDSEISEAINAALD